MTRICSYALVSNSWLLLNELKNPSSPGIYRMKHYLVFRPLQRDTTVQVMQTLSVRVAQVPPIHHLLVLPLAVNNSFITAIISTLIIPDTLMIMFCVSWRSHALPLRKNVKIVLLYAGKVKSSRPSLRETRDNWPLGREPDISWCHCHTKSMIRLYWS